MQSRRSRIIALSVFLAIAGAILPLAAMTYVSWKVATAKELTLLKSNGERALARAEETFAEAHNALTTAEASTVARCSPEHIALMRILTVNADAVEEIGYFNDGLLMCSSWGPTTQRVTQPRANYTRPDGMGVTLRIKPVVSLGRRMLALQLGSHNALVAPSRFVDLGFDGEISLVLATDEGKIINLLNDANVDFARRHLGGTAGSIDGEQLFATVASDGMVAVVSEPVSMVTARMRTELVLLMPVALFMAVFIVAIVILFSRRRLSPRGELEIAVHKREFVVHYQPIIALSTGICVGAEALVRWKRPDGSLVRPDFFIPLAEETGLILPITDQVMDAVIRDMAPLLRADRGMHVAINIAADDIRTGRFLDMIQQKLSGTDIRNPQVMLEATERGFIDIDAARVTLARARTAGHPVAIDDFGTGYSSLQYLQGLPVDALKIDKSFIDTIGRGTATSSVTSHIIEMAGELGLHSVAEGVETEEQASYLRERGVTFGQGWLFSRPLPADEFILFYTASAAKYGHAPEHIGAAA